MFTLELFDRNGTALNLGDIVKISDGKRFTFFAEVKYIESDGIVTPFHTFSFHSFEKVDSVPENAKKGNEERYNIWYVGDNGETDETAKDFKTYLMEWRECEHHIDKRMWKIKPISYTN